MSYARIIGMNNIGEQICASAAKLSNTKGNSIDIFNSSTDAEKNRKLIKKVFSLGHHSVIEHVVFNIAFVDVSAVVEQFFIEFRLASFMVKSRRYVDFADAGFYIPDNLDGDLKEKYISHMNYLFKEYVFLVESGIPKEDARFVLPYCFHSNFYCTLNARELLHILQAMLLGRGTVIGEIKALGEQILSQAQEICPSVFTDFYETNKNNLSSNIYSDASSASSEKVEIISYPKNAEEILSVSAQVSGQYGESGSLNELANKIVNGSRSRELEQLNYTFKMNGISLSGITHLTRHRIQSLIVPPLFSVSLSKYIIPDSVNIKSEIICRYKKVFELNREFSEYLQLNNSLDEIKPYVCLSGNTLDIMSTMNARELLLFFKLRTCNRAQWEIHSFATDLLYKLRNIFPELFSNMGPSCYCSNSCPEGKQTCGRMADTIKSFGS